MRVKWKVKEQGKEKEVCYSLFAIRERNAHDIPLFSLGERINNQFYPTKYCQITVFDICTY